MTRSIEGNVRSNYKYKKDGSPLVRHALVPKAFAILSMLLLGMFNSPNPKKAESQNSQAKSTQFHHAKALVVIYRHCSSKQNSHFRFVYRY